MKYLVTMKQHGSALTVKDTPCIYCRYASSSIFRNGNNVDKTFMGFVERSFTHS